MNPVDYASGAVIAIPAEIMPMFLTGGWTPTRREIVPWHVPSHHPAHVILTQLGGLTIGECGPGTETPANDIAFRAIEPDEHDDELALWQPLLSSRLVSIADVHHGHAELFVDERWRFFTRSYIHDAIWFDGDSFATAMKNILLGYHSRPMLRPGQASVRYCGIEYTAGSPELYRYE
jgi:hypothetical protein